MEWGERFLVSPPAGCGAGATPTRGYLSEVVITAAVTDVHAAAGNGSELASTALALDELLMPLEHGQVFDESVELALGAVFHGTLKLPLADNNHDHDDNNGVGGVVELDVTVEVAPGRYFSPRHPAHGEPSFIESNSVQ